MPVPQEGLWKRTSYQATTGGNSRPVTRRQKRPALSVIRQAGQRAKKSRSASAPLFWKETLDFPNRGFSLVLGKNAVFTYPRTKDLGNYHRSIGLLIVFEDGH